MLTLRGRREDNEVQLGLRSIGGIHPRRTRLLAVVDGIHDDVVPKRKVLLGGGPDCFVGGHACHGGSRQPRAEQDLLDLVYRQVDGSYLPGKSCGDGGLSSTWQSRHYDEHARRLVAR